MSDELYTNTDEWMDNPEDLNDNDPEDKEDVSYLFNTPEFLKPNTDTEPKNETLSTDIKTFLRGCVVVENLKDEDIKEVETSPDEQLRASLKQKTISKSEIQMSIDDFRREVQTKITTKDLIDTIVEVASGYKSKGDKLDLLGWDILDTEKRHYKYVSLQAITDFSRRDTTIRKAVFRNSFVNFIKTGEKKFVPVLGDELVSFIIEEVFQSPDLLPASQGYDMFKRMARGVRGDGTPFSVSELADSIRFSCTPDALRVKFNTLVSQNKSGGSTLVSYYAKHNISLDKEQLSRDFSARISASCKRVVESGQFGFVQEETIDTLKAMDSIIQEMIKRNLFHVLIGPAGSGKAMPKGMKIPTPNGEKTFGELKVGDFVFDRKGHPTKVLGVYDRGVRPCFELTFSDGRKTRCCDEHLWTCYTSKNNFKTLTLKEMMELGIRHEGRKEGARFRIPTNECVEYEQKTLPVHPYIVGAFLGDGCCKERNLTLSSDDLPVVERVAALLDATYKKLSTQNYSWIFIKNGHPLKTKDVFKEVAPCLIQGSNDKRIPSDYLYGSREQRIALLQGLFDTDGSVSYRSNGMANFSTTSKTLYENVSYLLRSLGIQVSNKSKPVCRGRVKHDGTCFTDYTLTTYLKPEQFEMCFSLPRQLDKLKSVYGTFKQPAKRTDRVALVDVREVEPCEQQCILVDNEEHLFLANDFIVTHNTHKAVDEYFPTLEQKRGKGTLLVSLSTLVAINGADRATKRNKPTNPCSITMFNFCKTNPLRCAWVTGYDTYCIDEFSQWGLEQLDTFMSILKRAYQERSNLVILGDLVQIGTFLGRGNLLYMLTANYPYTELSTNHRIKDSRISDVIDDIRIRQARYFEPFRMDMVSLQAFLHTKPSKSEMCITGSNAYAGLVNELKLEAELRQSINDKLPNFYVPSGTSDWNDYDVWKQNEEWIRSRMKQTSIKVRPKENYRFEKGIGKSLRASYSTKFLRNETCIAMMSSEFTVCVTSCVFKTNGVFKTANISWGDFIQNFVPYYAITVNKAQGLEWDDVVVLYGNPEKLDERQGAYVPKKNYNLNSSDAVQATYVAVSRPRETLRIFYDGIRTTKQNTPVFANHLDILKELDLTVTKGA